MGLKSWNMQFYLFGSVTWPHAVPARSKDEAEKHYSSMLPIEGSIVCLTRLGSRIRYGEAERGNIFLFRTAQAFPGHLTFFLQYKYLLHNRNICCTIEIFAAQ